MTNEEFFSRYADEAMIGLVGGTHFIDRGIRKAQKKIRPDGQASAMSHVFIVGEKRRDGHRWIIESDFDLRGPQPLAGVQENRIAKYFDDTAYPNVALLDFVLDAERRETILKAALDFVSERSPYSFREIFGIMGALTDQKKRAGKNLFSKENGFVCSTFVQHLYAKAGINFNPSVSAQHITPEEIFNTEVPCKRESLMRLK